MHWLERTWTMGVILLLAACSDDGLTPPADAEGESGVATSPTSGGSTGGADQDAGSDFGSEGTLGSDSMGPGGSSGESGPDPDSGDSTGGESAPMCVDDRECVVINDCCQCSAVHVDEMIDECAMECLQPMCDALGIPDIGAVCRDGTCGLEERNCSDALITCDSLTPRCPPGSLPEVTPQGDCWTGACIPVEACDGVPGCEYCLEDEVCVEDQTQLGPIYHCEPLPPACGGMPTCDCLPDACEAPFDTCLEGDGVIQCACPVC